MTTEPLYLTARDGVVYRVHDLRFGPHAGLPPFRRTHHPPPDARANYRIFLARDGTRRQYLRRDGDDWSDLSPATLQRQLDASGYAPRSTFDASMHGRGTPGGQAPPDGA